MGIRFTCPSGHKLHVKTFLAGNRGVCPHCGAKFVIPTLQQSEPSPARPPQVGVFTSTGTAAPADTASQSIIIAVADERLAAASPADGDSSEIRLADSFGPPTTAAPPVPPPPPRISTPIAAVESPAAWHVSRRRRDRRKQFHTALVLLVTVILLALVLIWVVQRSADQSSVGETKLSGSQRLGLQQRYAALRLS